MGHTFVPSSLHSWPFFYCSSYIRLPTVTTTEGMTNHYCSSPMNVSAATKTAVITNVHHVEYTLPIPEQHINLSLNGMYGPTGLPRSQSLISWFVVPVSSAPVYQARTRLVSCQITASTARISTSLAALYRQLGRFGWFTMAHARLR